MPTLQKTAVLLAVALDKQTLAKMPKVSQWAESRMVHPLAPVGPAVTCSSQSAMLTGASPSCHGIVGNGWYDRDQAEIHFWKQSNHLVQAPKVWQTLRQTFPQASVAKLFWWFNMHAQVDFAITPRPQYKADGRKLPDIYSQPLSLRDRLQRELGTFPLFKFWGPGADITSTQWIADAAKLVANWHHPDLLLTYLPHLDYALQKFGPDSSQARNACIELDHCLSDLIHDLEARDYRVMLVSEYGIEPVHQPVHINRRLREAGLIEVRDERDGEVLVPGGCKALAVADHQIAHVYVNDAAVREQVKSLLEELPGVGRVLDQSALIAAGLNHPRTGDFLVEAAPGHWFTYYYWLEDQQAPDFARTVDIHRKPGYDPVEMFVDPNLPWPRVSLAWKLLKRRLGLRQPLDVIPLDASLIKGSHGRMSPETEHAPLVICEQEIHRGSSDILPMTAVRDIMLRSLGCETQVTE